EHVDWLVTQAIGAEEPHVIAVLEGNHQYADALKAVEDAQHDHEELRDDPNAQRVMGMQDYLAALENRKDALQLAREHLTRVRPVLGSDTPANWPHGKKARKALIEAQLELDRWDLIRQVVERIVIRPAPRGAKNV